MQRRNNHKWDKQPTAASITIPVIITISYEAQRHDQPVIGPREKQSSGTVALSPTEGTPPSSTPQPHTADAKPAGKPGIRLLGIEEGNERRRNERRWKEALRKERDGERLSQGTEGKRLHQREKSAYLLARKTFTSVAYWKSDTVLSRVLQHQSQDRREEFVLYSLLKMNDNRGWFIY